MKSSVRLREVIDSDLPVFFEQQLDAEAVHMAAFATRGREAFFAHWSKIRADETTVLKTIVLDGQVAGNIVSWEPSERREIGYWLGKEFWGKGIATAALAQFLQHLTARPLYAHVAAHNVASIKVLQKCGFTVSSRGSVSEARGEAPAEVILILARTDGTEEP